MNKGIPIKALSDLQTSNLTSCHLVISGTQYIELAKESQEVFTPEYGTSNYYTVFPVDSEFSLIECIIAFCEITLVSGNRKYEITEQTDLTCNLFKLVKSSKHFSLLVNIQYPNAKDIFHDVLTFEELSQTDGVYRFQLLGDKSMFRVVD